MATQWTWDRWSSRWAGSPEEDLAAVFTRVRVSRTARTRAEWARDERTRAFCELGAYLLHQHHLKGEATAERRLFRNLGGEELMRLAARLIPDQGLADSLDRQRWSDTWGHQEAYIEDLLAYIFRSGPTLRRILEAQQQLVGHAQSMPLGELIRAGVEVEMASSVEDPVVALQTFLEAALPHKPTIREAVARIESEMLRVWATLYEVLLTAYGVRLRPGVTYMDIAALFNTVIEGALLRTRSLGVAPRISTGEHILAAAIIKMLPGLCEITPVEVETRRRLLPVALPDAPVAGE
ncbi:hypothetical protein ACH4NV_05450 [Streptomyces althioticus]|jgi:hypothetical protein|uniref:hypothetical protein n=1 Tax=Streptomyces althioticus TaxID=83380 RepID=UPI00368BB509